MRLENVLAVAPVFDFSRSDPTSIQSGCGWLLVDTASPKTDHHIANPVSDRDLHLAPSINP